MATPRWIQRPQLKPFRWPCSPNILVDIFYNKDSAPLDVDLSTRLGNTNLVVSVTNSPRPQASSLPAVTNEANEAACAPPPTPTPTPAPIQQPSPPPVSNSSSGNQITIDTNGEYINANIILPLRNHRYRCYNLPQHGLSNRFSNCIVDKFLKPAN